MKIVELWKHHNYTISETGIITNIHTTKVSTLSLNKEGYLVVPYKQSKESIAIAADKQAISKRKLTNSQIQEIQTTFDKFPTYTNSLSMQLKKERSNLINEFCIKFNISYSVVGRIIRRDGRYKNGF